MNGIKIEMELGLNCIEKLSYKCNRKWVLFFFAGHVLLCGSAVHHCALSGARVIEIA